MEINEARRLKELERENGELKKMLAEEMLKNRVLQAVCEKKCKPRATAADDADGSAGGTVLWAGRVSDSAVVPLHVLVSGASAPPRQRNS
jgi:hypothetical protein